MNGIAVKNTISKSLQTQHRSKSIVVDCSVTQSEEQERRRNLGKHPQPGIGCSGSFSVCIHITDRDSDC